MTAARFWLRDIWGPQWDSERRALLVRHYWSYAAHAAPPSEHRPALDAGAIDAQRAFCHRYLQRIDTIQRRALVRTPVRLTFRPIGKNVRHVATALRHNVDRGVATDISDDPPPGEARSLGARGHAWHPWLWSRSANGQGPMSAADAWGVFFDRPARRRPHDRDAIAPLPPEPACSSGALTARQLRRVLKLAVATGYVFSPVADLEAQAGRLRRAAGWPPAGVPVLGMHVRRSDAASSDEGAPRKSNRKSFAIASYLEAADRICEQYAIRHVFLATESDDEIARAARLRPHYTFLTLPHDRTLFPDISTSAGFIEELALKQPERARPLAVSAILDLQMLGSCQAFVGAFNSEFSVLAWLLCTGIQGHAVPFVSLSRPDARFRLHPYDALLNVRNNCPLELYHW